MYELIKCSICKQIIENVNTLELVEKFEWIGTGYNINKKEILNWYCPKHSVKSIMNFEGI